MSKLSYIIAMTSLLILGVSAETASAQIADDLSLADEVEAVQSTTNRRIKRKVEPVHYWIDVETLPLRDNPVAGRIVGKLGYGQQVLAYSQYENWVQVSKPGEKQQWVNSDFLSNSRLSWASYRPGGSTRSSDVITVRIKDPEDRKTRIFGVRLKTAETGNALITTYQDTGQGRFYQNRFVSCENQRPVGARLVGEGYSFLDAQNDVRGVQLDIYGEKIDDQIYGSLDGAITAFACKAQSF